MATTSSPSLGTTNALLPGQMLISFDILLIKSIIHPRPNLGEYLTWFLTMKGTALRLVAKQHAAGVSTSRKLSNFSLSKISATTNDYSCTALNGSAKDQ